MQLWPGLSAPSSFQVHFGTPHISSKVVAQRAVLAWFLLTAAGQLLWWTAVLLYLRQLLAHHVLLITSLAIYVAYLYGPGRKAAETCTWPCWFRRLPTWKLMAEYFPARLVKTAELDPSRNYIFCMHPHGIIAISAWLTFATEGTGFSRQFPGIEVYTCTLDGNFRVPLLREYILLHGLRSAGRRTIRHILTSKPGRSVLLAVGGAAEALVAAPGTYDLVLGCRKGFVRMALETGADLVPVIAFGETDVFDTYHSQPGSLGHRISRAIHKIFGVSTPIFWGVGLTGGWGMIAKQAPLNTVIGRPIPVSRCVTRFDGSIDGPDFHRLVDEYHAQYVAALHELWDAHKTQMAPCRRRSLEIVQ